MAKKKTSSEPEEIIVEEGTSAPVPEISGISLLSVDYGREDINDIARKINEIIIKVNG